MVKGLAKHENRLRHVLRDKCVDASLFGEERLLPNDRSILTAMPVIAAGKSIRQVFSSPRALVPAHWPEIPI